MLLPIIKSVPLNIKARHIVVNQPYQPPDYKIIDRSTLKKGVSLPLISTKKVTRFSIEPLLTDALRVDLLSLDQQRQTDKIKSTDLSSINSKKEVKEDCPLKKLISKLKTKKKTKKIKTGGAIKKKSKKNKKKTKKIKSGGGIKKKSKNKSKVASKKKN